MNRQAQKSRRGYWYVGGFLVVLLVAGALYYGWRHTHIAIQRVVVEGPLSAVSQAEVRSVMAPFMQHDFLRFPVTRVQQALLTQLPWLVAVRVLRLWPPGLRVLLQERTAMAVWNQQALLSTEGVLFTPSDPWPQGLPQWQGPAGQSATVWSRFKQMQAACPLLAKRVQWLRMDARRAWDVRVSPSVWVRLGRVNLASRWSTFCQVYAAYSQQPGVAPAVTFDWRYPNGFVVGPYQASNLQA